MSGLVTRKRQGLPKKEVVHSDRAGLDSEGDIYTPKGSLFPWKECLLFDRIASFSEEV